MSPPPAQVHPFGSYDPLRASLISCRLFHFILHFILHFNNRYGSPPQLVAVSLLWLGCHQGQGVLLIRGVHYLTTVTRKFLRGVPWHTCPSTSSPFG